jgi:hypothetical protein
MSCAAAIDARRYGATLRRDTHQDLVFDEEHVEIHYNCPDRHCKTNGEMRAWAVPDAMLVTVLLILCANTSYGNLVCQERGF